MASKTSPLAFIREVRSETAKVTWPSRRETMISTIMVLIMVAFASVFFFLADLLFGYGMNALQNLSF